MPGTVLKHGLQSGLGNYAFRVADNLMPGTVLKLINSMSPTHSGVPVADNLMPGTVLKHYTYNNSNNPHWSCRLSNAGNGIETGVMSWKADEDNKASIKLAEKCGFIHNYHDKKMKSEFFFITNGTKMKEAIDEGGNMVIQEFKQPKPLNPNIKDYELLSEKEKRELETLSQEIREWAANVRKREGTK